VLPRDLVDALCPLRAASASPLVIGLIVSMFAFCTRIVEALTLAMGLGPDASSGENRPRSPTAMASRSPKRWNSPPVAGHLQIAEKQAPGAKRAQVEPRSRRREHGWADKAGLGKMQRSLSGRSGGRLTVRRVPVVRLRMIRRTHSMVTAAN
jgi:hypothetical protein